FGSWYANARSGVKRSTNISLPFRPILARMSLAGTVPGVFETCSRHPSTPTSRYRLEPRSQRAPGPDPGLHPGGHQGPQLPAQRAGDRGGRRALLELDRAQPPEPIGAARADQARPEQVAHGSARREPPGTGRPREDAPDGTIVVALVEDEATVKRLDRSAGRVRLVAENPAYSPIEPEAASMVGEVKGLIRSYS